MREYKKNCAVKIQEIISWKREGDTTATKYKVIKVAFVPTGGFRPFRDEIHVILITRIQPLDNTDTTHYALDRYEYRMVLCSKDKDILYRNKAPITPNTSVIF